MDGSHFHTGGFIALIVAAGITILAIIYIVVTFALARRAVLRADRDHFNLCDLHGAIREQDMLVIAELDDDPNHPIKKCPLCYTENINHAKQQIKKQLNKTL